MVKGVDVLMLHPLLPDDVAAVSLEPSLTFYEPRRASLLARGGKVGGGSGAPQRRRPPRPQRRHRDDVEWTSSELQRGLTVRGSPVQVRFTAQGGCRGAAHKLEVGKDASTRGPRLGVLLHTDGWHDAEL